MARGEGEQHGYDVGVVETKESLRAEVPAIYQAYCTQTWSEALNRAGVEALSNLRKPENIFYPPAIQASAPPSNYDDVAFTVANPTKEAQPQDPSPPSQQELAKEPEVPEDALSNVEKPLEKTTEFPQDRTVSQIFELVLASATMPVEGASKKQEKMIATKAAAQVGKTSKDKLQIKLKK